MRHFACTTCSSPYRDRTKIRSPRTSRSRRCPSTSWDRSLRSSIRSVDLPCAVPMGRPMRSCRHRHHHHHHYCLRWCSSACRRRRTQTSSFRSTQYSNSRPSESSGSRRSTRTRRGSPRGNACPRAAGPCPLPLPCIWYRTDPRGSFQVGSRCRRRKGDANRRSRPVHSCPRCTRIGLAPRSRRRCRPTTSQDRPYSHHRRRRHTGRRSC